MAGITTSCASKAMLYRTTYKTTPSPLSLSSVESKLFGLRFNNSSSCFGCLSSTVSSPITARFGGGPRFPGNDPRRSRKSDSDEDEALDVSSIRSDTVRLIDAKQNMVGVVSKREAIRLADDADLDLVILSPEADPPVLRIMDYNKYRYEQQKKKRGQQKKSAASRMDLKELKMGYNIDQHDYSVRLRAAQKFLKDGDKVKVIVHLKGRENDFRNIAIAIFRKSFSRPFKVIVHLKGRENDFRNIAIALIKRFQNDVGELATEEAKSFSDKNMFIVLVPNKAILQKAQEPPPKKKENSAPAVNEISAGV